MAEYLFPTYPVPDISETTATYTQKTIYGPYFDISLMDIARQNFGKIKLATEQELLMMWCVKAIATERYSLMAYTDNYGVELESAMQIVDKKARESAIEKTITETLMADPLQRIYAVRDFIFTRNAPDSTIVEFTVVTRDNLSFKLSAELVE